MGKGNRDMKTFQNDSRVREAVNRLDGRMRHCGDDPNGIVLALPDGGLAMAYVVGRLLRIPVHVFIAQNLRAPCHCPCAIGGLTETNVVQMDPSVIARQQWPYRELRAYIERETQRQRAEIARQRQLLRSGRPLPDLTGRHVLFADDGTTSLVTLIASIESFRKLGAGKIVAAMPAVSFEIMREVELRADELIVTGPTGLLSSPGGIGMNSPGSAGLVA